METRDQASLARLGREAEEARPDARTVRPQGAERMRALQRSAGNHVLSAHLAREPEPMTEPPKSGAGAVAVVPDVGTVPILSMSFGPSRRPPVSGPGAGGSSGGGAAAFHDVTLSSAVGEHSPKLQQAVANGKPGTVEIAMSSLALSLKNALISSYSVSGGENATESWSVNFDTFEQK
jgi:Type VI secretion system effector, Hcp